MRPEAFENVDVEGGAHSLPLRSLQQSSRRSGILHFGLLSTLAGIVVVPQLALAVHALTLPETRALILSQPLLALDLTAAFAFWIGLFGWPLKRLATRISWRRELEITRDEVAVNDRKAFGARTWTAPLNSYSGIAHHIRTSLSGTRHELVLVHPDQERSVLLMVSEHIPASDIARFSRLLGLPEISAKALYGRQRVPQAVADGPGLVAIAA